MRERAVGDRGAELGFDVVPDERQITLRSGCSRCVRLPHGCFAFVQHICHGREKTRLFNRDVCSSCVRWQQLLLRATH
jgi:hypothetical protein